jgi:dUTP pyrophosphatase
MALLQLYAPDSEVRALYDVNPNYASDSGFNLYFPDNLVLQKGTTTKVNLKVSGAMFEDGERLAYFVAPRSSISKTRVRMANGIGIIDAGYSGCFQVALDALDDCLIERGESLFQVILPSLKKFPTVVLEEEQPITTERGADGFGSTNSRLARQV